MRCLKNDKGVALITALMVTLISLVIILGFLYVVTQGVKTGGSRKVYRNAVEASYAGTSVTMYDVLPQLAKAILEVSGPTSADTGLVMTTLETAFSAQHLYFNQNTNYADCLNQKLTGDPSTWSKCPGTSSSVTKANIVNSADMTFDLDGTSNSKFKVYTKIVDTIPGTTYMSPLPGGPLLGGGVTDPGTATVSSGRHFIYRIEVVGEKADHPSEQGNLTVMYEY